VIERWPSKTVASLHDAGRHFNDGVLLDDDRAPMGPTDQREFQVETQLLSFHDNGWTQVRLGAGK